MQEIKRKIESMHQLNDPTTLTFDTSVDLSLSDENDISDEKDEVLDLCSF